MTRRLKVLYVLPQYPQLSESYIETELKFTTRAADVRILSWLPPDYPAATPNAAAYPRDVDAALDLARDFGPDLLHGHWLSHVPQLFELASRLELPFTVRSHSFDIFQLQDRLRDGKPAGAATLAALQSPLCREVLAFPPFCPVLAAIGVPAAKLRPAHPVADIGLFEGPPGNAPAGAISTGACLPKKGYVGFMELARRLPEHPFRLYPIGYQTERMRAISRSIRSPVEIMEAVPLADMPGVYRNHQWLVIAGDPEVPTLGWPVSVAEAQACGLGVCIRNLRPDLRDYVGEGGALFDTLEEAEAIISRPPSPAALAAGREQARRSDFAHNVGSLVATWDSMR